MCRVFWAFRKGKITFDFRGLLLEGSCKQRVRVHTRYTEKVERVTFVLILKDE